MGKFSPELNPLWVNAGVRLDAGYFAAVAIRATYSGSTQLLDTALGAVNGIMRVDVLAPGDALLPRIVLVEYPQGYLAIFRGTTREMQFFLHVVSGASDVLGAGPRRTNAFWKAAGTAAVTLLTPFLTHPTKPIALVGHSYGAACALVATDLLRANFSGRIVNTYVLGCPKTGNASFCAAVAPYVRRFENDGDPVVLLPPPTVTRIVIDPFGITPLARYLDYQHAGDCYSIDGNGNARPGAWSATLWRASVEAISDLIVGQNLLDTPHNAGKYSARLGNALHAYPRGWADSWIDFAALFTLDAELTALGVL